MWAALGALVAVMVWPYLEYKWVGLVLMASAYAAFATRTPAAWLGFAAAMVLLAVAWYAFYPVHLLVLAFVA